MTLNRNKTTKIIDFHTHAFPDSLAPKALAQLTEGITEYPPTHDGTIHGILKVMDESGVYASVVCSIATKPTQERPILDWSKQIVSDRIMPFISLHADGQNHDELLKEAKDAGIRGVKFHCMYQGCKADEERMFPLYESCISSGMVVLFHAGRDIRWPKSDVASPERLRNVHRRFPEMVMVAAHFGGWRVWDEVLRYLAGEKVVLDTSFTIGDIHIELWKQIWQAHDRNKIVFASDSPWASQKQALDDLRCILDSDSDFQRVSSQNAAEILRLTQ